MSGNDDINPMLPGQKIISIFGFCDIRNFTDATEVLQEGVMVFVNEIGEIVHKIVDNYGGAANKNIGDAFLLVWKFDQKQLLYDNETDEVALADTNAVHQLCDMALISFLKIMVALKKAYALDKYRHHQGLNARMPGFEVKMGYGLHLGWAIEGALGSFYKIDATYLSPHVNMAGRLEAGTKIYGVMFLLTGDLYDQLTPACKAICRQIDHVWDDGQPLKLFTVDVQLNGIELEEEALPLSA